MKIGNVSLENAVISAPLAGISDNSFRLLARRFGCGLVYSEMLSSMALVYQNSKTSSMAKIFDEERPVTIQLAGWRADIMAEAAKIAEASGADIIDINAGCSVRKVIKNCEGSYLLKDVPRAQEIIRAVVRSVRVPVTIKIRKAWCGSYDKTLDFAKMAEAEGVSAIAVHGRTPAEHFSGKADWNIIRLIKEKLSIPVIGNGDVRTWSDGKALLEETGCDGIMIGRASLGNPWVFSRIAAAISGSEIPPEPSVEERLNLAMEHYEMLMAHKGEEVAFRQMRKFLAWYIKGLRGASRIREKIFSIDNYTDVINLMTEYRDLYEKSSCRAEALL